MYVYEHRCCSYQCIKNEIIKENHTLALPMPVFTNGQADKVQFIQHIKDIPSKEARNAEMALFCGQNQDAEGILLQASLTFRAIMLNIQLYNWDRWVCHNPHASPVMGSRHVAHHICTSSTFCWPKLRKFAKVLHFYQATNQNTNLLG